LYEKHEAFLAKLEEREKLWYSDEKEDCIGDIFYLGVRDLIPHTDQSDDNNSSPTDTIFHYV